MPIFPATSVAVTVTGVVPMPKKEPLAGRAADVAPGQLSVGNGILKDTLAPHCPALLLTVTLLGQLAVGASVSLTVTLKLHMPVFPAASVAVTVTGVVPMPKKEPLAGKAADVAPGQLSVGIGILKDTLAPHCPTLLLTVTLLGQLAVGASVSLTVTIAVHLSLKLPSFTVNSTVCTPVAKGPLLSKLSCNGSPSGSVELSSTCAAVMLASQVLGAVETVISLQLATGG